MYSNCGGRVLTLDAHHDLGPLVSSGRYNLSTLNFSRAAMLVSPPSKTNKFKVSLTLPSVVIY